jgi:hypothetical protein
MIKYSYQKGVPLQDIVLFLKTPFLINTYPMSITYLTDENLKHRSRGKLYIAD